MATDLQARRRFIFGLTASLSAAGAPFISNVGQYGRFDGKFVGRFVGGGSAVVERPLSFIDPDGRRWTAPAGAEVNGASIPRALWSIVGAPFTGDYLRAAVVHDHYCTSLERDWRATHLAFYYGCRADGLSRTYANLLYAGVMRFGPRWNARGLTGSGRPRKRQPRFDELEFEALRDWVERDARSVNDIDAFLRR